MNIDELPQLEVVIEDAKFYFDASYAQQCLDIVELGEKALKDRWAYFLTQLQRVENLFFKGEAVTVEMIRAYKLPTTFTGQLYGAWQKAVIKSFGVKTEAESKNDSSDSSAPASTSQS